MSIFVDTSVWYAATDQGDRHHDRAKEILSDEESLVLTDHVLVECWHLIRARGNRKAADRFWESIRKGVAAVEPVTHADLEVAWEIGRAFLDQDFSIVDTTSFAVMQRLGIQKAAAFDEHFAIYRYGPRRKKAFLIVR